MTGVIVILVIGAVLLAIGLAALFSIAQISSQLRKEYRAKSQAKVNAYFEMVDSGMYDGISGQKK